MALAGGVQVMSTPATFVEFSRLHGLSPEGRCKAFGAAPMAPVGQRRGHFGAEAVVVGPARWHRFQGVIRGSAVNQDGRSQGLTAPMVHPRFA